MTKTDSKPAFSQMTGELLISTLLEKLEAEEKRLSQELIEQASIDIQKLVHQACNLGYVKSSLYDWKAVIEGLTTIDRKAFNKSGERARDSLTELWQVLVETSFDYKTLANAALIPGSEGRNRTQEKINSAFTLANEKWQRLEKQNPKIDFGKINDSNIPKIMFFKLNQAELWESFDQARVVKNAIRQRTKSVRAILMIPESNKIKSLLTEKIRNYESLKNWAIELMDAFIDFGNVNSSVHGSYRTEWELFFTKIYPEVGRLFPDKVTFTNKRGRDVEDKLRKFLEERQEGINTPTIGGVRSQVGHSVIAPSNNNNSKSKPIGSSINEIISTMSHEITYDAKKNLFNVKFRIPGFESRKLLGVSSRISIHLAKELSITGISIKLEDGTNIQGKFCDIIIQSIPGQFELGISRIHDLLVEELSKL